MSDLTERLGQAIGDRYRVEGEVGRGGMATVFRGEDVRHGRTVAIKVLHPEFAAQIGAERFEREIEIVAGLTHPHILTLIDSGEADGLFYFVMPFVDGESLRDLLDREGSVPLDRALSMIDQVGSAIAYAHERGVIHRDIKPENILLSGDQAVVADFGIARDATEPGAEKLTKTGVVVGTPAYMSPEQALGDERIDGRSDVYGLGCVLYEALSGRPPFEAGTMQALIACHILETPPSLHGLVDDLPEYVERAVGRAMAKAPDDRFRTAGAFLETLRSKEVVDAVRRTRMAVLEPERPAGEGGAEALVRSLHEALISGVGRGPVGVLARTAVLPFVGSNRSVRDICAELEVDALVESSMTMVGDRVRIEARLVDGRTEEGLWSGSFEGEEKRASDVYAEVAAALVNEGFGALAPRRRLTATLPSVDPAAYERYVRGRIHQQRFTPEELEQAEKYYEAALRIDPRFAAPHAGISLIWGSRSVLGLAPALEAGEKWGTHAERAIQLDPELAEGHQALAQKYTWFDFDWERAETSYARSIALDPMDVQARNFFSHFLAMMQRPEESDEQILRSLEIDPLNPFSQMFRAIQLGLTGRHRQAIQQFQDVPPNPLRSWALSLQHFTLGDVDKGLELYIDYFRLLGAEPVVAAMTADGLGPNEAMVRGAETLVELAQHTFVKPNNMIHLFARGGDVDRAMEWVERAWEMRDHEVAYFGTPVIPHSLRPDPRFHAFLERMRLPHPDEVGVRD
jgi:serine/threonine-protein kinase